MAKLRQQAPEYVKVATHTHTHTHTHTEQQRLGVFLPPSLAVLAFGVSTGGNDIGGLEKLAFCIHGGKKQNSLSLSLSLIF